MWEYYRTVRDEALFKKPSLSHENLLNKTVFFTPLAESF